MSTKIAVVTGVSSGIGESICKTLLQKDYKIYGVSTTKPSLKNSHFIWIKADLREPSFYSQINNRVVEDEIDVLINNAGIAIERGALDVTLDSFEEVFGVNFKAPILLTKALRDKIEGGLVINISSVSDRLVGEKYSLYCSSKAALNIYFDVIALEEKGFKVVSILPSYVDTPLLRKLQENRDFPWDAVMKPDQIAEFVQRIIEEQSSIDTGTKIIVISDSLKEDLEDVENLWGYNVDTRELFRLKK